MNLSVRERKLSFASEYDITGPAANYYARKSIFSFNDKLHLKTETGQLLARIRGYFSPLRARHDFLLNDGRIYRFRCEKLWKRVYVCEENGDCFRLYEHKGLKYSIFHQDRQIAAFTKNRLVVGKGNQYEIRMDADASAILVLCLVLTVNSAEYDDDDNTVTINLGNIGPEARPFDRSWEPR